MGHPKVIMDELDGNELHIEKVDMTPIRAQYWLDRVYDNQRKVREKTKVRDYARDMLHGNWPLTGDTIKVSPDDLLLDGQHRLAAVVTAGVTVPMLVAFNVDPAVMPVLDTGLKRSFADVLAVHTGAHARPHIAALVRRILQWEAQNYTGAGWVYTPTHSELLERFQLEPDMFLSALKRAEDARRQKLPYGGTAAAAFFIFRRIDHDAAHEFFDGYISGANLTENHPVLTLRDRVREAQKNERLKAYEVLALFVRAWTAVREDRPLQRLQVSGRVKLTNQNFPLPK